MPTSTAYDLIAASLRKLGVHPGSETVTADEASDALDELNRLLSTWTIRRRLVYQQHTLSGPLTGGVPTYTLGPGGTFSQERLLQIRSAYSRLANVDYPCSVVSADQWALITLKSLPVTWPVVLYYEAAYPLATLYVWPVPASSVTLFLVGDVAFTQLTQPSQTLSFPPGYADALVYALGKRLAPEYGVALDAGYLDDWRQCEMALSINNHQAVVASQDAWLPGRAGRTDAGWIYHGGSA